MKTEDLFQKEVVIVKEILQEARAQCVANEDLSGLSARINFVKKMQQKYYSRFTESFIKLTELAGDVGTEVYEKEKKYLRENLYDLIAGATTVVNKQICEKPLGYAGDYVVADYFYKDGYSGSDLYGMLMDRYTVESLLAKAHKNRQYYLGRLIEKLAYRSKGKILNVFSLACGPAPEVFDIFDKKINNVSFTLLDGEPGVLRFLKEKLKDYSEQSRSVRLFQENIINMLRKDQLFCIPSQDLVYCAGFFDYIRKGTATKLIRYMLKYLKPGGWLIVVNVSKDDARNVYLKMIGEWDLYHRSHQDCLDLVPADKEVRTKKVVRDAKTGRNLYLIIRKRVK